MISFPMARRLKQAGLKWTPRLHDFFAVPERGMDTKIFVISDLQANIEKLFGSEVVAFQGASEWALDYLITSEAVWMPREEQLREVLLASSSETSLHLDCTTEGCHLDVRSGVVEMSFDAQQVGDAYAQALLHILGDTTAGNGASPES
jgi:hypothetical protein